MKSKVALIECRQYDEPLVYDAIEKGIELIGGLSQFVKPGEKIVLKPNVLWGSDPQKCVTTHPAVFKAVGRMLQKAGATVTYGDSAGFGPIESHLKRAGLKAAADELNITLADFENGKLTIHKTGLQNKQFVIANGILAADGVVSLPKLKAHGLMRFTGAVKNQFGCIPGMLKSQFHVKLPDSYVFAAMLADLDMCIKPRLYIMDGITAMEGNGPRNGRPRRMNVLLFSSDPVAMDAIACKLINLNPEFVPTCSAGAKAGLGTCRYDEIEVVGDNLEPLIVKDFDVVRKPPVAPSHNRIMTFLKNELCPRPVIDKAKCSGCGTCVKVCPVEPKAVDWDKDSKGKIPAHTYNRCIRCFCCQELCPEGAITVKETALGRLLFR